MGWEKYKGAAARRWGIAHPASLQIKFRRVLFFDFLDAKAERKEVTFLIFPVPKISEHMRNVAALCLLVDTVRNVAVLCFVNLFGTILHTRSLTKVSFEQH